MKRIKIDRKKCIFKNIYFYDVVMYNIFMNIAGISKISLSDYKNKVACVLFTSGCNFRCDFCHNSSLVDGNASIINEEDNPIIRISKKYAEEKPI